MAQIKNLTKRTVWLLDAEGTYHELPSEGVTYTFERKWKRQFAGIPVPVVSSTLDRVKGLPKPKKGVFYLVDITDAEILRGQRDDLLTFCINDDVLCRTHSVCSYLVNLI
jgi:hypothetical protein